MNRAPPLHSVIVPVLNGARYIGACLESILAQLGPDDELIVVDNGSTDGTPFMVESHADPRILLLREPKRGPAAARNTGLAVAKGQLISFLDHDDYWPQGRQSGLLAALAADPAADAAYGRLRVIVEPGCDDQGLAVLDGTFTPALGLTVYLLRREILGRTGPMDESLAQGEDTDYIVRLRQAGMRTAVYDGDAAVYRRHESNMTLDVTDKRDGLFGVIVRNLARKRSGGG
jgi:glycosyltransferase involved in cell wall biosynthesis